MKKILISGYYGFDNFGDDAILQVIVSELKKHLKNPKITVISNNPEKTKKTYSVDSIYKLNFKDINKKMNECDVFISGGGSLLQDVTSFKSFIYYLGLIALAKFWYQKKTIVFAQGIGPISTAAARILTRNILNNIDLLNVRDKESQKYLKKLGVNSVLAADPVWCLEYSKENSILKVEKINIGLQIRQWKTLSIEFINIIADVVAEKFNDEKNCINLISLQDSHDLEITQKLKKLLLDKNLKAEIRIFSSYCLSIDKTINLIGNLDFLIAMRFHACLAGASFNVPTLALSYDPKVTNLALEAKMPFVNVNSFTKEIFTNKIDELTSNHEQIRYDLKEFSDKKTHICRDNFILLINTIIED